MWNRFPGVELAYKASRNALNDGTDYSNGACFWDGVDLKVNGENAYRYKARFKLANKNHNVLSVIEPPPLQRRGKNNKYFEYTYISRSGINKTIFWKYTKEALEAGETKGKICCNFNLYIHKLYCIGYAPSRIFTIM